jgi:hypothetical protein
LTLTAGPWSGAIIERLNKNDPEVTQYGPARIELDDGSTQSNPLATVYRLVGDIRGTGCENTTIPDNGTYCDGQVRAPNINTLSIKIGKTFKLGGTREFELGANIFNIFNWSGNHQFTYSAANRTYSANYAQLRSLQAPQGVQLTFRYRF